MRMVGLCNSSFFSHGFVSACDASALVMCPADDGDTHSFGFNHWMLDCQIACRIDKMKFYFNMFFFRCWMMLLFGLE